VRGEAAWWEGAALVVIAALAGLAYGWAAGREPLEPYYAAAVRSMSMSWHNFFYGAFDPAGTVTLDKLPGAFWVQALAVRVFGLHPEVIMAPQAIEGVATVLVLYRAVQRMAGPAAGLIAAAVAAVSPAAVALNRGNISDSLMILLLVLAADAVSAAVARGSQARLVLAGLWVGLAFQAKMVEAWLVLPAFGLAYLLSAPGPVPRRIRQLVVAGAAVAVVSLSWMTVVSLLPAAHRPYIDGSQDDSAYQQVFAYNGLRVYGDEDQLQLAGQTLGLGASFRPPATGPARLLHGDLGRDAGWLLPAALVTAGWGIASRRRRPRGDPLRTCLVLWGGWLVTLAVAFSLATNVNAYYMASLAPPVAAVLSAGAAAWLAGRPGPARRIGLAVVVAGTSGYAAWLVASAGTQAPGWLLSAVIAAGLAATAAVVASIAVRREAAVAVAIGAALVGGAVAPAVACATVVARHQGWLDTPFEPAGEATAIDAQFGTIPDQAETTIGGLESLRGGAPDLFAAQSAAMASVFVYDTGQEVLPIGGFTGTAPSPTLAQLRADIRQGRFHLVILATTDNPRLRWIAAHCQHLPTPPGGQARLRLYFCRPRDAT
jgi:4-amino-4-deoxy-L-arabinose transferase-like glycosyltransferase